MQELLLALQIYKNYITINIFRKKYFLRRILAQQQSLNSFINKEYNTLTTSVLFLVF